MALLALALALGAWLRFAALGANEMSADEGASWAAAAAPDLAGVVRIQAALNPGKLAVYEIVLHGWMRLFGDRLGAMRALSAALDTLSIIVVFALVRELLKAWPAPEGAGGGFDGLAPREAATAAAFAAVLFAVNLVSIKYARELRMYPLALLIVLLQAWVFIRAVSRGSSFDLIALAVLTALAVAIHFSAAFAVVAEALWLAGLRLRPGVRTKPPGIVQTTAVTAALGAGAVLFLIFALPALRTGAHAFVQGATGWIERPRWWAPIALFNKGVGSFAFPLMAGLAAWGAWRGWIRARSATAFALLWMWTPPLLMLVASYVFAPMFVERYALWSFVPFFALAALGALELRIVSIGGVRLCVIATIGAMALSVVLALAHLHTYYQRPHDTQWREAARAAADNFAPGMKIAVAPPYAVNVVRYYLRDTQFAEAAVPAGDSAAGRVGSTLLIVGDQWNSRQKAAKLLARYPYRLAGFRGVAVHGGAR